MPTSLISAVRQYDIKPLDWLIFKMGDYKERLLATWDSAPKPSKTLPKMLPRQEKGPNDIR